MKTSKEIEASLKEIFTRVLELREGEVEVTAEIRNLPIDSIAAVQIVGELEDILEMSISPTVLFEFPTIRALSEHLGAACRR